jgi:hypothetical protein
MWFVATLMNTKYAQAGVTMRTDVQNLDGWILTMSWWIHNREEENNDELGMLKYK